jgi:hypothetical protein
MPDGFSIQQMAAQYLLRNLKDEMFSAENDGVAANMLVYSLNITTGPQFILSSIH